MVILLFTLIMLSIVIFIYESIILPSIRLRIRYQIFELRDKLRFLKIEKGDTFDDTVFRYSQESLNMLLAFLHRFDCAAFVEAERIFQKEPEIHRKALERQKILDGCNIEEFKQIRNKYIEVAILSAAANSLGLLVLLILPIIAFKGMKSINDWAKNITAQLFSVPERDSEVLERVCLG
jgi:hypothetical protein